MFKICLFGARLARRLGLWKLDIRLTRICVDMAMDAIRRAKV